MAHKTNEQKLRSLIKDLHTIEVALLVERIETMMKLTLQDIEEKPESYDNFFVSHHAYVNLANKVINQLKWQTKSKNSIGIRISRIALLS